MCDIWPFNSRGDSLRRRHIFFYEVPVTFMNWFHLLEVTLGSIVFPTCLARCNLFFFFNDVEVNDETLSTGD